MADKLILNSQDYIFTKNELPCLVAYEEKSGGSHLTMTIVANLFLQGSKILILTAYHMAKDNFLEQVGGDTSKIAFVNNISELESAKDTQAIILESGNENLFLEVIKSLSDLQERVVLIKNIEKFSNETIESSLNMEKVILSGHLDECISKEKISNKKWKTINAFNQPKISLPITVPELEKYNGYLLDKNNEGIIKIQK